MAEVKIRTGKANPLGTRGVLRPKCPCGWFVSHPIAIVGLGKCYAGPYITAVVGWCKRHGGVEADDWGGWGWDEFFGPDCPY